MRIIFVRHGEPDYEKDCLTELGVRQAQAVAQRLLDEGIETLYSSPLGRARQTAQAFAEAAGAGQTRILDFMREIRYGREGALYDERWNPWTIAGSMAGDGQSLQNPQWRELPLFKDNTATVDIDRIAGAADTWLSELGYRREGLYYRNCRPDSGEHTAVLFCHGGSTTAVLSRVLNQQFPYLCAILHLPFTAITILRFSRHPGELSAPVVELAGDSRHIRLL